KGVHRGKLDEAPPDGQRNGLRYIGLGRPEAVRWHRHRSSQRTSSPISRPMSLGRSLLDHAIRYRRFGSFAALGARRAAARRTYRSTAMHDLLRRRDPDGPGWGDVAGFRLRYLGAQWSRYLYREGFAERQYWFATYNPRP